jgi:phenylpropionate dioxygenase-like ring-hydroxylating dioxygenase large terminal subunit
MFSKKQNDLLNQTNAGTPLGEVMRRYWIPALLAEEIPDPDCAPVRVGILGEALVAFRDTNGDIGLLGEHCAHRGTSLFHGRNEGCGLRCGYHGWKYDVAGNVLEMPAEPPDSTYKNKIKHLAYPTREVAGIVFTYMGPKDEMPAFPNYEWTNLPADRTYINKSYLECSWLQGLEGEADSAHLNFLHRSFNDSGYEDLYLGKYPEYVIEDTDFGMRMVALREGADDETYFRVSSFVMPLSVWVPAREREVHMYVPIEDGSCWRWDFGMTREPMPYGTPIPRRDQVDDNFFRFRTRANNYMFDRHEQRTKNFLGVGENFLSQDAMATETMGRIFDRTTEHLGASDKAVIALRNCLLKAIDAYQKGEPLPHTSKDPEEPTDHIDTFATHYPKAADWRELYPHLAKLKAGEGAQDGARAGTIDVHEARLRVGTP